MLTKQVWKFSSFSSSPLKVYIKEDAVILRGNLEQCDAIVKPEFCIMSPVPSISGRLPPSPPETQGLGTWHEPSEFSVCVFSSRRLMKILFWRCWVWVTSYSWWSISKVRFNWCWRYKLASLLLTISPVAFPGVIDVPFHMARKQLWNHVTAFRM